MVQRCGNVNRRWSVCTLYWLVICTFLPFLYLAPPGSYEFMPQIITNILRRAWLGASALHLARPLHMELWSSSMGIWVSFKHLHKPLKGRFKRPHSISGAEGVHQHHAHPSALHIAGMPSGRKEVCFSVWRPPISMAAQRPAQVELCWYLFWWKLCLRFCGIITME